MIVSVNEYDVMEYQRAQTSEFGIDNASEMLRRIEAYRDNFWIDSRNEYYSIRKEMGDNYINNTIDFIKKSIDLGHFKDCYVLLMKMYYIKLCGERQRRLDKMIKI